MIDIAYLHRLSILLNISEGQFVKTNMHLIWIAMQNSHEREKHGIQRKCLFFVDLVRLLYQDTQS